MRWGIKSKTTPAQKQIEARRYCSRRSLRIVISVIIVAGFTMPVAEIAFAQDQTGTDGLNTSEAMPATATDPQGSMDESPARVAGIDEEFDPQQQDLRLTQSAVDAQQLEDANPAEQNVEILGPVLAENYRLPSGSDQMGPVDRPAVSKDPRFVGPYEGISLVEWNQLKRRAHTREWIYQGLNLADVALTCTLLSRGGREINPIFGKNASCGTVAAVKGVVGLLHWLVARRRIDVDPRGAGKAINFGMIIQGLAVGWNLNQLTR